MFFSAEALEAAGKTLHYVSIIDLHRNVIVSA